MPLSLAERRLDSERLFEDLDRARRHRRMTRKELCAEIGVSGATFTGWGRGYGISGNAVVRIAEWLDVDVRDYVKQDEGPKR